MTSLGHGVGIGQEVHLVNVKSGEAGGGTDQQARGRAGRDVSGFSPGDRGQVIPRRFLQLLHAHAPLRRFAHGVEHIVVHWRAAKPR